LESNEASWWETPPYGQAEIPTSSEMSGQSLSSLEFRE